MGGDKFRGGNKTTRSTFASSSPIWAYFSISGTSLIQVERIQEGGRVAGKGSSRILYFHWKFDSVQYANVHQRADNLLATAIIDAISDSSEHQQTLRPRPFQEMKGVNGGSDDDFSVGVKLYYYIQMRDPAFPVPN